LIRVKDLSIKDYLAGEAASEIRHEYIDGADVDWLEHPLGGDPKAL